MVVMGVVATRLQSLGQWLDWDGENMKFTNIAPDAKVKLTNEIAFSIHEGHPSFKTVESPEFNAQELAAKLIKPDYHNGYKLPEIPII